jgi:hypothetical protein
LWRSRVLETSYRRIRKYESLLGVRLNTILRMATSFGLMLCGVQRSMSKSVV